MGRGLKGNFEYIMRIIISLIVLLSVITVSSCTNTLMGEIEEKIVEDKIAIDYSKTEGISSPELGEAGEPKERPAAGGNKAGF